jgi:hypothetical protein
VWFTTSAEAGTTFHLQIPLGSAEDGAS